MAGTINIKDVESKLQTGPSPHIRNPRTSKQVMTEVIIALIPPIIAAIYFFGWWVFVQLGVALLVSVLSEYGYQKLTYQKVTLHDRSVYVTGLLLGLSFPISAPLWVVAVAAFIAVFIIKHWNFGLGGGLGKNYLNPALTARVIAKVFFTPFFANWVLPKGFFAGPYGGYHVDYVTTATPLEYLSRGATEVAEAVPELWEMFLGVNMGGNIGETSKLAILIGMIYLIVRRVINPKIPILFILSTVTVACFWSGFNLEYMMAHALSGTLFFAATYMATDYSSGALTPDGKTVFAIAGGLLTGILRIAVGFPGAIGIAIIIMNIAAPFIDSWFLPRIYGHKSRPERSLDRQSTSLQK